MNETIEWGWLVVVYLFCGGMSAGLFFFSGLANYLDTNKYGFIARWGAYLAPFPVSIGSALLIFDLGRPFRFLRLFFTVELTSPMSIGSWLLVFFSLVSLVHAYLWLPERFRYVRIPNGDRVRNFLGAFGMPLALGVGIYTGILLGAVPARPFWNTPMVAQLFLFSGMSSGVAALILLQNFIRRPADSDVSLHDERVFLLSADAVLILVEVFLLIPYILHNSLATQSMADSLGLIIGGEYMLSFWVGVVLLGLLVPLAMETRELWPFIIHRREVHFQPLLGIVSAVLVLVGGICLRYVFVFAGQHSHFG